MERDTILEEAETLGKRRCELIKCDLHTLRQTKGALSANRKQIRDINKQVDALFVEINKLPDPDAFSLGKQVIKLAGTVGHGPNFGFWAPRFSIIKTSR